MATSYSTDMHPDSASSDDAQEARRRTAAEDQLVEEASEESFPASDPPAWTPMTSVGPAAQPEALAEAPERSAEQTRVKSLTDKTRAEYEALSEALHRLEAALASPAKGREREWCNHVVRDLGAVHEALKRHAQSSEEPAGLFAEICAARPCDGGAVERLRQQHAELQEKARLLQIQLEYYGEQLPASGEIRRKICDLLSDLRQHQADETDLVFETFVAGANAG